MSARHGQDAVTGFPVNDYATAAGEESNYVLVDKDPVEVVVKGKDGKLKGTGEWRLSGNAISRPFYVDPVSYAHLLRTGRLEKDSIFFDVPSPSASRSPSSLLEAYRNSGANE